VLGHSGAADHNAGKHLGPDQGQAAEAEASDRSTVELQGRVRNSDAASNVHATTSSFAVIVYRPDIYPGCSAWPSLCGRCNEYLRWFLPPVEDSKRGTMGAAAPPLAHIFFQKAAFSA